MPNTQISLNFCVLYFRMMTNIILTLLLQVLQHLHQLIEGMDKDIAVKDSQGEKVGYHLASHCRFTTLALSVFIHGSHFHFRYGEMKEYFCIHGGIENPFGWRYF